MIRQSIPILILLLICCYSQNTTQIKPIDISSYVIFPQVIRQKMPTRTINKLVSEGVTQFLKDVNFQLSSYLYTHKGAPLGQNDIYNVSRYDSQATQCKLYKTDLRLRQYRQILFRNRPVERIIIENKDRTKSTIATIYTSDTTNTVKVVKINIPKQNQGIDYKQLDWQLTSLTPQQGQSFPIQVNSNSPDYKFLQSQGKLYIVGLKMTLVKQPNSLQTKYYQKPVKGYQQSSIILKADQINDENQLKRFYTFTPDSINIYQFISQEQVKKVLSITDLQHQTGLQNIIYDSGFFYVVGLDSIYVIDVTNSLDVKTFKGKLNGTCTHLEKFSSTLHVSCRYNKIDYVVEFLVFGSQLRLNRYYAGEDIQGRVLTKRVGLGKMVLVTDNSLKIVSYALNKHALIQYDRAQPQYSFSIRFGIDLIPIQVATTQFRMTFVLFTAQKLAVMHILQVPPQLYCQFPVDSVGASYQYLLQFNTTRCTYVLRQQNLMYGNIESMCQITIPIQINSRQIQIQAKQSNFIMIIMALLITGLVLIIIAFAIKYNRSLEIQFHKLQKKLQQVKKGYNKQQKITI